MLAQTFSLHLTSDSHYCFEGADIVIFVEHDWNPHADLQAMDRAHRIGQTRNVQVYRIIASNSVDEKIMKLQETKLAISQAIVNTDNSTMYSMRTDRLLDIFTLERSEEDTANETAEDLLERYVGEYSSLSIDKFIEGLT